MNKLYCTIFVAIVLSTFKSLGAIKSDEYKPGYIITRTNDSISGFILIRNHSFNSMNCLFKSKADGETKSYTALDLIAYGVGQEKYFYAYQLDVFDTPKTVFLECLVKGKKSLFFYQYRYFIKTPTKVEELIIESKTSTKDGKNYVVKLALYKSTLNQEMSDCSSINEYLQQTELEEKKLKQLFIKYYECIGATPVVYENESQSTVTFGFSAGAAISQLHLGSSNGGNLYFDSMDASTNTGLVPSFWITFSSSRTSLQLRTGLTYYTASYRSYFNYTTAGQSYEYAVSCSRIEIPLHLKYHPLRNNKALYVVGGAGFGKMIKWDDKLVISLSPPTPVTERTFKSNPLVINFLGGAGYEIPLNKNNLFLEASYSLAPGVFEADNTFPTGRINSINICVGISF